MTRTRHQRDARGHELRLLKGHAYKIAWMVRVVSEVGARRLTQSGNGPFLGARSDGFRARNLFFVFPLLFLLCMNTESQAAYWVLMYVF